LLECLDRTKSERTRFGLLLALGEFSLEEIPRKEQESLLTRLSHWYGSDPNPAIHAASDWLLRHFGHGKMLAEANEGPAKGNAIKGRQWFVERIGELELTFVVFSPGQFLMGSPKSEYKRVGDETQHIVRLTRPFAICDREVTVEQWFRFLKLTGGSPEYSSYHSPTGKHPINAQPWYRCVKFCRWLTQKAGMSESQQCYPDPATLKLGRDGFPLNWAFHPERPGYRLPTEAEWEYACRSGTRTTYSFGSDRRLLEEYAWFIDNSNEKNHAVASKRPNLRGLFDMYGNVYEWCHDWYGDYPADRSVDPVGTPNGSRRVLRGGGWNLYRWMCRSALRHNDGLPTARYFFMGFRVARTLDARK
ncbi:MAG: formylglycine-generating enzyme family protein, partial [Planctomycetes bacterium]|nr:formylglycine-generating enzyme family protein [Planctomycetota bacterium]